MSAFDHLEPAADDLDAILVDVLGSVLGEEAVAVTPSAGLPPGPVAVARLAIHDETDDDYAVVEVRAGVALARVLASRMMFVADPGPDEILDAVAELGNITGGNVKSLLCQHARLSLPAPEVVEADRQPEEAGRGSVQVGAVVLGHVAELTVIPGASVDGLLWPPRGADDVVESHQ